MHALFGLHLINMRSTRNTSVIDRTVLLDVARLFTTYTQNKGVALAKASVSLEFSLSTDYPRCISRGIRYHHSLVFFLRDIKQLLFHVPPLPEIYIHLEFSISNTL